jgi:hypothetical protein
LVVQPVSRPRDDDALRRSILDHAPERKERKIMKGPHPRRVLVFAAMLAIVVAGSAFAADPPVKATVTVVGDAVPGAAISAKAAIAISDGSTFQSITWKQIGGVPVTLTGSSTDTVSFTLPSRNAFKIQLVEVLEELPISVADFPAHVPEPAEFMGGLQDRWGIVAIAPHAMEEAAAIKFELTVVTTSGTYKLPAEVDAHLPWPHATGLRNVPLNTPVLLNGKSQKAYNWAMIKPTGSNAALMEPATRNPEFVPDVAGTYEITVTDEATNKPVTLNVYAGNWRGMIAGQDSAGLPVVEQSCTSCHTKTGPLDKFTPWTKSGHAEIFIQNVNTPGGHYAESCVSCHTVGYDKGALNAGIDEAQGWQAFVDSGLLTHADPLNWTKILTQFPAVAKMANIQCENCHGPQDSAAHMKADGSRISLSSDLCGTCHGEPARHGRFQQWQLSKHANYELAREEGTNPSCSKCHSSQGFIAWQKNKFSSANLNVTWTTEEVHPATCATCHDPHDVGTTSGNANTNSRVRVSGTTPKLDAGFTVNNAGTAAICMTCHNSRRGIRNDSNFNIADASRATHLGPQTDVLMGENMYFATTGKRGFHAMIKDSCVTCHMESTEPPAALSYNKGGTNHAFFASKTICSKCHESITAESVQGPIEAKMEALKEEIEAAILLSMKNQIRAGNAIDLGGKKTIRGVNEISAVEFIESHGRQGITATLSDKSTVADLSLQTVKVVRPGGSAVELYAVTDPAVAKAGWNYFMAHSDGSHGVHNPGFIGSALDVSLFAVKNVITTATTPPANFIAPSAGGGIGNFQGAVNCTTPYVYWAEIAGHLPGNAGSDWRTDLVARNLGTATANLKFILHQTSGNLEGTGTVAGSAQKGFEDIVATLGGLNNKGALEVCSDQPLLVMGRIFNKDAVGTFGQNLEGHVADLGYTTGQTVSLIGLRQKGAEWRTNISVTNGGTTEAQVLVTLFRADGSTLTSYNLTIPAGQVLQDVEPFRNRAMSPDIDWGFATVTVLKGTNIRTMGALIDGKTNDPTTIPPKQ